MIPCLNLSVARLSTVGTENFAIWVLKAPYPGGYVLHDCPWPPSLNQKWQAWQELFASHSPLQMSPIPTPQPERLALSPEYGSRLMQYLGIGLWQWLFDGPIQNSLAQSQGIAIGQDKPLRIRLEIRDPDLIALPWEIMQPQPGKPAISLAGQFLFSRTTSDVDPLPPLQIHQGLNILLVLGQDTSDETNRLQLEQEATTLEQTLKSCGKLSPTGSNFLSTVKCQVDILLQPTSEELISQLETQAYNIFFYAGHGLPGPDGGLLFLRPGTTLNGTELAQVLTRCRVTLAVFNACWGAQPAAVNHRATPRSSLAEVLIHHGVPAVLGMRDSIADREALSFIQAFAQALAARLPIDQAVAVARQQLLTLYKYNYPTWTLPVLYLHPEFDGELIWLSDEGITELPENSTSGSLELLPAAWLRSSPNGKVWSLRAGVARVGRLGENDIVISEPWVSQRHAEIFCRNTPDDSGIQVPTYFLRDDSRYGTWLLRTSGWQRVHRQEVSLQTGMQLRFGSSQGQTFEFSVEG